MEACAAEQIVGCVEKRKATDKGVGKALASDPCPGPGGIDLLEVIAAVKLMREFEVVKDSKDGLGNFHEIWLLSLAMLADGRASSIRRMLGTIEGQWFQ